jgi:phospholipase A1
LGADPQARLACFDSWAQQQRGRDDLPAPSAPVVTHISAPAAHDCKVRQFSELSRFWELEAGSDCSTFGIRGYKPISLSWIGANSVNTQPSSPSADHTASVSTPYSNNEARIGLSVRTKIAQGLLTQGQSLKRDSLWFSYSQQSYWQLFNTDLSRPFRSTDHEPELIYIYPLDLGLPGGWRWRYGGLSINHQSNGQSLPLSRSWNRNILMAGFEQGNAWRLEAKLWHRVPEAPADDDNPDISDLVGRAEVAAYWNPDPQNTLGLTLRHSLRAQANGSLKLEWLRRLADSNTLTGNNDLRFHTQLFSGYGDSLVDYNRRRTVLSVGLSLVDW